MVRFRGDRMGGRMVGGKQMNRHERRRAFAQGKRAAKTGEMPDGYTDTCETMALAYRMWRRNNPDAPPPRFALPPRELAVIAGVDQVASRIVRNESAAELVELFDLAARFFGGPNNGPTVLMLSAVLEVVGVEVERVSPGELGLTLGGVGN
jgi:hypothetical protein